jgi:hypothetical protein
MHSQHSIFVLHSIVDLLSKICVNSTSSQGNIDTNSLHQILLKILPNQRINGRWTVRKWHITVGISFSDEVDVDLQSLELIAVVRELSSDFDKTVGKVATAFVSLGELLFL